MQIKLSILLFVLFLLSGTSYAQTPAKIDPENLDQLQVQTYFLHYLNHHRDSLGLSKLTSHTLLDQAAKDHTDYMVASNILSHDQPKASKKTPRDRVIYYQGNFKGVGENILFFDVSPVYTIKEHSFPLTNYKELGYALFLQWKYSPPHYANMITPDYQFSGLQVSYQPVNNRIYAANVFGMDEYHAPTIFPNYYSISHIKPDEKGLYKELTKTTFAISTANFIYYTDKKKSENELIIDSVAAHYYDIKEMKAILNKPKDAIMIDYVLREQFTCKSENKLDFSPIYDGWPQEPVYTTYMYSNSKSKRKDELDFNLNKIPESIKDKEFQSNVILIKDNLAINYTIPLSVPRAEFEILEFKPLIDIADQKISDTTFVFHYTDKVFFQKGTSTPIEDEYFHKSLLQINYLPKDAKLKHVEAIGYSSIEGDSIQNKSLQEKRVNYIKDLLINNTELEAGLIKTKTKENKEQFYKDYGSTLNFKPNLSLIELNKIYGENQSKISEGVLSSHRFTELNYDLELTLSNFSSDETLQFIYSHIDELNPSAKTKFLKVVLSRLQNDEDVIYIDPEDFRILNDKNLLLPLYYYASDSVKFKELYKKSKLVKNWTEKDKFNFVISAYKYYETYDKSFIPLSEIHANINLISKKTISDSIKNLLWLNYYLMETKINYDLKKVPEMNTSLANFKTYYFKFDQKLKDIIKIGMFFNNYSQFDWTLELLYPELDKHPKYQELWFTYLNTYTFAKYGKYDDELLKKLIINCKKINKNLFCEWISNYDFQLLRVPVIKEFYCFDCEK